VGAALLFSGLPLLAQQNGAKVVEEDGIESGHGRRLDPALLDPNRSGVIALLPPLAGARSFWRPAAAVPTVQAPDSSQTVAAPPRRFLTAAGTLALLEVLPWAFNRYVTDQDFARISWHTVSENYHAGFGFDSDSFNVNQSEHPYHGSLFFETGRSNGYSFWESGVFALAGSFLWECCMENTRPSLNDLVNTTLGGMTRGEVSHRLAAMILDNTASGSGRFWRELGAGVLNPVGAVSRLVHGETSENFPNPEERFPSGFGISADLGYRHIGGGAAHPNQATYSFSFRYGDPFAGDIQKPFDSFWGGIDVNFPGGTAISRIEERGVLKAWELTDRDSAARHIFGFSQEYEYLNNEAEVVGAQILGAGMLSRYDLGKGFLVLTDLGIVGVPLAGIQTTNFASPETGRNYDYAPGGGARTAARFYGAGRELVAIGYGVIWAHTVNGVSNSNTLQFFRATGRFPIAGPLGAGGAYSWYSRKTTYTGFFEARKTQSEWRVFLNFSFGANGLRTPKV
jgi:hypothetical protein